MQFGEKSKHALLTKSTFVFIHIDIKHTVVPKLKYEKITTKKVLHIFSEIDKTNHKKNSLVYLVQNFHMKWNIGVTKNISFFNNAKLHKS